MPPYVPEQLPINDLETSKLVGLVSEASAKLAEYNGMLRVVVNPNVLLSPLTNKEAVLSSKIEGTQATLVEVLEHEAGQDYEESKQNDIKEIINYRNALLLASDELTERPLRLSLVLQLHKILMDSVRGQNKDPGEFRKEQNWIGNLGSSIEEATYIPPSPLKLMDHLHDWENYLSIDDIDPLIQTAIVHAQFELIHPFKDGNGRIGRLLIPLFLYHKSRLSSPNFYLSGYLDSNKDEYYARLKALSSDNREWTSWVEFFLVGIISQATDNISKVSEINDLYDEMKQFVVDKTHSQFSPYIVDAIFNKPIFTSTDFIKYTGMAKQTAYKCLSQLEGDDALKKIRKGTGQRPSVFYFRRLIDIIE